MTTADIEHSGLNIPKWLEENLSEIAKDAQKLYILYLSFVSFCLLSLFSIKDSDIILGNGAVTLPIINVQVNLLAFFVIGPLLALVLYITFQLHFLRFTRIISEHPEVSPEKIFPFMLYHSLVSPEKGLLGSIQSAIAYLTAYLSIPILLLAFTISVIKRHDILLISLVWLELFMALSLSYWFLYKLSAWTSCKKLLDRIFIHIFYFSLFGVSLISVLYGIRTFLFGKFDL